MDPLLSALLCGLLHVAGPTISPRASLFRWVAGNVLIPTLSAPDCPWAKCISEKSLGIM